MHFKILENKYTLASLDDIKLGQLIALNSLKSKGAAYLVDAAHIITGEPKERLNNASLEGLSQLVEQVQTILEQEPKTANQIELDGKILKLPTIKEELNSLFTDLTVSRYATIEALTNSVDDLKEGKQEEIAALLACLYMGENETFTEKLFLERKDKFLNAPVSQVYTAFFLQKKRLQRFIIILNYYLKVFRVALTFQKKLSAIRIRLGRICNGLKSAFGKAKSTD